MKRALWIVGTVVAIYATGLGVAWTGATSLAHGRTRRLLRTSRETFAYMANEIVDNVLWYASGLLIDEIGPTCAPLTADRMKRLADRLHVDELNIVDAKGRTIASNLPSVLGYDFASAPVTAEFLRLLDPAATGTCHGQPYRPSAIPPHRPTKYFATAFPDRSGFVQLGFTLKRLSCAYAQVDPREYRDWRIGHRGYFEAVVGKDGYVPAPADYPAEGVMGVDRVNDEQVYTCTFAYAGFLFRAVMPTSEFEEQRNVLMTVGGLSLAVILAFLTFLVLRLFASSEKLAALHRAAAARTAADLSLARVIQDSSLPRTDLFRPSCLDCAFDAASYPAREVGGDFYDVFEVGDGRIAFLIADVSGKGVPAAIFMHIAVNLIETAFRVGDDMAETVAKVNDYLCEHNEAEMFVTAWFGLLDPVRGEVTYVNAGHNRPYVLRRDGRVERVDGRGGLILGAYAGRSYRSQSLTLGAGDRLFLYTDGVTEAMDAASRTYGVPRLEALLATAPADLCAAVRADVDGYVGRTEQSDDLTMLSLAWYGRPPCVERTFSLTDATGGEAMAFLRAETKLRNAKRTARLLNAADEMIANVVAYSGAGELRIAVENVPGRCRVTLSDDGRPYDPLTHADPDTHLPIQDRPIGGLGILMTKKLVDSVAYRREGARNVLALVQRDRAASL